MPEKATSVNDEIVDALLNSKYWVHAIGCRDVGRSELKELVSIIRFNYCNFKQSFENLYKYHPDTIEQDRKYQEDLCSSFGPECDCFLPDVPPDECWCERERRERLLNSNRRNYPEYQNWRTAVFERDGYTCQKCGKHGGELNAHHIKRYSDHPELRLDIDNGITLCKECHEAEHRKGH
jgi:5-methylcytosine-specific restriction endonuclease McrA